MRSSLSRRGFLQASVCLAVGGSALLAEPPAGAPPQTPPPPGFPADIQLYPQAYHTWSGETHIPEVWTASPRTPEEVVLLANWAHATGWRLRPKGMSHGWSPLLLPHGTPATGYLLVDTTRHLTTWNLETGFPCEAVRAQTGVSLDVLLDGLGDAGLGFAATPAVGDVTLGGVLAVNGHGAALPALGETPVPGQSFGSLSNAVLELTAVVWDAELGRYALRRFRRDQPGIQPLLAHAGRAFITEAVLQVGPDRNLRCRSYTDIPAGELFADPAVAGDHAFQTWVRQHGRVEAIWFPFAECPWLKVWTVTPSRPWQSRKVSGPYSYTFANWISPTQAKFLDQLLAGNLNCTPAFQQLEMNLAATSLGLGGSDDIWGPSRYSTLYVKPTTLRLSENGYAVLTSRDNIQRVVHDFCRYYRDLVSAYQIRGEFPMNGPVEIRVTGLDQPSEVALPGALVPQLSALRPRPDHPAWDCAVWLDALTFPGTPGANAFYTELEAWLLRRFSGQDACLRVEWSKGWGYTTAGPWTRPELFSGGLATTLNDGQSAGDGWLAAQDQLRAYDPHRVFSNPFLDRLMP